MLLLYKMWRYPLYTGSISLNQSQTRTIFRGLFLQHARAKRCYTCSHWSLKFLNERQSKSKFSPSTHMHSGWNDRLPACCGDQWSQVSDQLTGGQRGPQCWMELFRAERDVAEGGKCLWGWSKRRWGGTRGRGRATEKERKTCGTSWETSFVLAV